MSFIALVAMICGPVVQSDIMKKADAKNCYVQMITCVEHKMINPYWKQEDAIRACVLEL